MKNDHLFYPSFNYDSPWFSGSFIFKEGIRFGGDFRIIEKHKFVHWRILIFCLGSIEYYCAEIFRLFHCFATDIYNIHLDNASFLFDLKGEDYQ